MIRRILIGIVIIAVLLAYFVHKQPFTPSQDMAIASDYTIRSSIPIQDPTVGHIHYSKKTKNLLDTPKDTELLGLRCSDSFIRTDQGAYILENKKIGMYTRRITNDDFITFMREKERVLPTGKKILTAKICETTDNTLLLFYSIGQYDTKTVGNISIRKIIANSSNNSSYVEVISKNVFAAPRTFEIMQSKTYLRCDLPFQIQKNNTLSILCREDADWISNYYVYEINLKNGAEKLLGKCTNSYKDTLHTTCN